MKAEGCQVENTPANGHISDWVVYMEVLRDLGFKVVKLPGEGIHSGGVDGERWLSL